MEEEKVIEKIDNMLELSQAQQDRQLLSLIMREDLLVFLQNQINRVVAENELEAILEEDFRERALPNAENPLSDGAKIKLYEIIKSEKNILSGKILELFKETQRIIIQQLPVENKSIEISQKGSSDFTKEEMQKAKKLVNVLDFVETLKKSEFSEEEITK